MAGEEASVHESINVALRLKSNSFLPRTASTLIEDSFLKEAFLRSKVSKDFPKNIDISTLGLSAKVHVKSILQIDIEGYEEYPVWKNIPDDGSGNYCRLDPSVSGE
jgi:hypothetical protein